MPGKITREMVPELERVAERPEHGLLLCIRRGFSGTQQEQHSIKLSVCKFGWNPVAPASVWIPNSGKYRAKEQFVSWKGQISPWEIQGLSASLESGESLRHFCKTEPFSCHWASGSSWIQPQEGAGDTAPQADQLLLTCRAELWFRWERASRWAPSVLSH